MSEDKKTIQEALAEVQKNAELKRVEEAKKVWGEALQIDEAMAAAPPPSFDPPAISGQRMAGTVKRSGTATGRFVQPQRVTASAPGKTPSRALVPTGGRTPVASSSSTPSAPSGSKGLTTTGSTSVAPSAASAPKTGFAGKLPTEHGFRAHSIPGSGGAASAGDKVRNVTKYLGPIGAAAIGGAQASNILGGLATGTETGRNIGKAIGELPGAQTAANLMRKAGEAIGVRPKAEPETPTPAPSAAPKAETTPKVAAPTPAPSAAPKVATSTSTATAAPKAAPSTAKEVPTIKAPSEPAKVAPSAAPKTADTSATTTKGGYFTKSPNVSKGDYTIKSGDTLSDIAKTHGTSVGAIQSMNKGLTDVNKIAAGGSLNLPTTTKSPETESGKKKKMSEDTNPLIAAFLDLQAKNPENMFVEAKKLSKKQDEKLDVVDDDKIDAKDLAALRAGKKKVDEANIDPVVTGSSSVTKDKKGYVDPSTPKVPYSELPKPGNAAGDVLSKAKNALDKTGVKEEVEIDEMRDRPKKDDVNRRKRDAVAMKLGHDNPEGRNNNYNAPVSMLKHGRKLMKQGVTKEETEVTFSQAEIDHINSFFLEASVAPVDPETTEAKPTSEKLSQNDLTATAESGKRKLKEGTWSSSRMSHPRPMSLSSGGGLDSEKRKALAASMAKYKPNMKAGESDEEYKARTTKNAASQRAAVGMKEETLEEGRPKKNPEPETTERDPRKHIQVEAGRAAAGNVVDFHHNDGTTSKITPGMGRRITSHLNGLKPADRQAAVNKMHDSAEGLKV
jgi:LysM repeat protein